MVVKFYGTRCKIVKKVALRDASKDFILPFNMKISLVFHYAHLQHFFILKHFFKNDGIEILTHKEFLSFLFGICVMLLQKLFDNVKKWPLASHTHSI